MCLVNVTYVWVTKRKCSKSYFLMTFMLFENSWKTRWWCYSRCSPLGGAIPLSLTEGNGPCTSTHLMDRKSITSSLPFIPPGKNRQIKPGLWWEEPTEEEWKPGREGWGRWRRATKWIVLLQIQFLIAAGMGRWEEGAENSQRKKRVRGVEISRLTIKTCLRGLKRSFVENI